MSNPYKPGRPNKGEPPAKPGEYRWRNKETGEIDYVGEAKNLRRRKGQQQRGEP